MPRLLDYVARFKSNEMLLITVLGLCFGVSLLAVKLGYSVALGAFLIGAIIAEARQIAQIEALIEPVRDMFSAVFFVSIGLLIDPTMLRATTPCPILVITAAVVVGKVLTCSLGTFVAGNDPRTSLRVGMGLAQIGEFSFIIAALGLTLKVTSDFLYPIAVAVSALTTLLTPYLIRMSDPILRRLVKVTPESISRTAGIYTEWLQSIKPQGDRAALAKMVQRILLQVLVNLALVAALFLAAGNFGDRPRMWESIPWRVEEGIRTTVSVVVGSAPVHAVLDRGVSQAQGAQHAPRGTGRESRNGWPPYRQRAPRHFGADPYRINRRPADFPLGIEYQHTAPRGPAHPGAGRGRHRCRAAVGPLHQAPHPPAGGAHGDAGAEGGKAARLTR